METLRLKKDIIAYPHYEFNEQDKILLLTGQEVMVIGEDPNLSIMEFVILNQGERYYVDSTELLSSLEKTAVQEEVRTTTKSLAVYPNALFYPGQGKILPKGTKVRIAPGGDVSNHGYFKIVVVDNPEQVWFVDDKEYLNSIELRSSSMDNLIKQFERDAKALGRDTNSVEEFNRWLEANTKIAGTWEIPDTKEKATKLKGIVDKLRSTGYMFEMLSPILGDDELADSMGVLEEQMADAIVARISEFLNDWTPSPEVMKILSEMTGKTSSIKEAEEIGAKTKVTKAEADRLVKVINNFENILDEAGRSLQEGVDMDMLKEIDHHVQNIQQILDVLQGSADINERPEAGE